MVKKISKGSLLGRSSSSSKDSTGLYLVSIVAILTIGFMFYSAYGPSSQVSVLEDSIEESSALVGQAIGKGYGKDLSRNQPFSRDVVLNNEEDQSISTSIPYRWDNLKEESVVESSFEQNFQASSAYAYVYPSYDSNTFPHYGFGDLFLTYIRPDYDVSTGIGYFASAGFTTKKISFDSTTQNIKATANLKFYRLPPVQQSSNEVGSADNFECDLGTYEVRENGNIIQVANKNERMTYQSLHSIKTFSTDMFEIKKDNYYYVKIECYSSPHYTTSVLSDASTIQIKVSSIELTN